MNLQGGMVARWLAGLPRTSRVGGLMPSLPHVKEFLKFFVGFPREHWFPSSSHPRHAL